MFSPTVEVSAALMHLPAFESSTLVSPLLSPEQVYLAALRFLGVETLLTRSCPSGVFNLDHHSEAWNGHVV